MPEQTTKRGTAPESNSHPGSHVFDAMNRLATKFGAAWPRSFVEWQQEMTRFATLRIEHDMDFTRSLAQCQNFAEMAQLQQNWVAIALRDYSEEAGHLMQLVVRAANE